MEIEIDGWQQAGERQKSFRLPFLSQKSLECDCSLSVVCTTVCDVRFVCGGNRGWIWIAAVGSTNTQRVGRVKTARQKYKKNKEKANDHIVDGIHHAHRQRPTRIVSAYLNCSIYYYTGECFNCRTGGQCSNKYSVKNVRLREYISFVCLWLIRGILSLQSMPLMAAVWSSSSLIWH